MTAIDPINPVRLCCGQRHVGAMCPDMLVMCCLCFNRVPADQLADAEGGGKLDVCRSCAAAEKAWFEQARQSW